MSIQTEALELFNKVWNSPNREEIKNIVKKLKASLRGYGNKIYPCPFLGLLLANQEAIKEFAGKSPTEEFESWEEREKRILFCIHNQIVHFNQLCLSPLLEVIPELSSIIDPPPYRMYCDPEFVKDFKELLFSKEDVDEIIKSFHKHPSLEKILSNIHSFKNNLYRSPFNIEATITKLYDELVDAGVGKNPKWAEDYKQAVKSKHQSSIFQGQIVELLVLRDSLSNINQLIYEAVFQEYLPHIRRGDIVDCLTTTTRSGLGMSVSYLPNGDLFTIEPGDLVFVTSNEVVEKRLCCIYSQTFSLDLSYPSDIELRVVDENMNSYGWLLNR